MERQQLLAAVLLFTCALGRAQNQPYFIARIPVPKDATSIVNIVGLDANGNAVGNVLKGTQTVPEVWKAATQITLPDVGTGFYADGKDYSVTAASNVGSSAGQGVNSSGNSVGVYWDVSGTPWELDGGSVTGVSDSGLVVGSTPYPESAIVWQPPSGNPSVLPVMQLDFRCETSPELCYSGATTISPNGKYIGGYAASGFATYSVNGVLWIDGIESGIIEGAGGSLTNSTSAINNSGLVVGSYLTASPQSIYCPGTGLFGPQHAYQYSGTTFTDLGVLMTSDPCSTSVANSVNASGVIVGSASVSSSDGHAVMWTKGRIADLQSILGPVLPANTEVTDAIQITDGGKILLVATNTISKTGSWLIATPSIPTRIGISSNVNPSSYGQPIHLVASVIPTSGAAPQGQVSWHDGGKVLGTSGMTAIGTASWQTVSFSPGVHNITVTYAGYSPDGASASAVFKQTVHATSTKTTVSSSSNSPTHGKPFTLIAMVVPAYGTIAGSVTFKAGTTTLGTASVDGSTRRAYLTTTIKTTGKYSVTATYAASTNFTGSTSPALVITVK